jgi:DNA-binding LacI/PurR family transcriptional regulator
VIAAEMLLQRMHAPDTPPSCRLLDTSLLIRRSTASVGGEPQYGLDERGEKL